MTSVLVALVVPVVLLALGAISRSQARHVGGWRVVEYNAGFKGFAWLLAIFASGIAIGSLFLMGSDRVYMWATSAIFALPAGVLFFIAYGTQVAFNDEGMNIKKPLKKAAFVKWNQVVNVKGSSKGSYVVELQDHSQIDLHAYMSGVPALLRQMQRLGVRGALLADAVRSHS